ncbi:MAG: phospho-N-acetylmuramoyl-pentapeptide-transferase [Candidatus Krumholzibacteriota bacterium]|nr:phospho-N-acetylmuramoyl-pentapeptide-transferase [Candidatus Krumholzibacteriota bacterium]
MLYHLLYPLKEYFFAFNVFRYITFRAAYATVTALLICFIIGPKMIRWLERFQIGQRIREEVPERHSAKEGTPTMGGVLMIAAIVVPTLLWANLANPYIQLVVVVTIWTGLIGFVDDYLGVVKKRDKGLVGRYKLLGQLLFGAALGVYLYLNPLVSEGITSTAVPFFKDLYIDWGFFYIPLVMLVITGTSNAVNLTDGLDGLATGVAAFCFLAFALLAYLSGNMVFSEYLNITYQEGAGELTVYCMSVVGSALGFLWFNTHPAQIFMGDTGSLALGGALGTVAVLLKSELLLIIIGGVFVAEALSVIFQVASFKITGKRIFKMAPIHHHFELKGWTEGQVVVRFWIVSALLLLLGMSTLKLR